MKRNATVPEAPTPPLANPSDLKVALVALNDLEKPSRWVQVLGWAGHLPDHLADLAARAPKADLA